MRQFPLRVGVGPAAAVTAEGGNRIPIPTSKRTAQQYGWGDGCEGWHLVRSQNLSVIEERMPPGAREVRHWHARARQFFYVIAGTLTLEVEGATHVLAPRSGMPLAHQDRFPLREQEGEFLFRGLRRGKPLQSLRIRPGGVSDGNLIHPLW